MNETELHFDNPRELIDGLLMSQRVQAHVNQVLANGIGIIDAMSAATVMELMDDSKGVTFVQALHRLLKEIDTAKVVLEEIKRRFARRHAVVAGIVGG